MTDLTPQEELIMLGKLVYGKFWQARLCKQLGVSRSTVGKWRVGTRPIPPYVFMVLYLLRDQSNVKR